ncbi:hypothetical protein FQN57_003313 [Myotisia sp. PD_48]|nr:hypothetical protein FQN57_003313 [Myotisia sp. PD_48]
MASLPGRPKRAGDESILAQQSQPESHLDGPSSKKPRFDLRNPSALAPDALEDDDILDADEIGRRGQKVRRNAVNIDGFDEDSENEGFDARAEAKAREKDASKAQADDDDGDDMFAELEEDFAESTDNIPKEKKKQVRFLDIDEIEGQVDSSRTGGKVTLDNIPGIYKGKQREGENEEGYESSESEVDDEKRAAMDNNLDKELGAGSKKDHAPRLDAFNMRSEQEEGRFDEAGNYVRKATDPDAIHDSWLEGLSKKDMRKAREAAEKREEERRQQSLANDSVLTGDLLKTLISYMERGETVLESLARLGKGAKPKPKWQNKHKNKHKKALRPTEDTEMAEEDPVETKRKRSVEEITGAADLLLSRGQTEIYDAERELLIRQYRRETGEEWVDPPKAGEGGVPDKAEADAMWEFRWSDARDGGVLHGPYDTKTMESWTGAGYFSQGGVEFKKVGDTGDWSQTHTFSL